MSKSIKQTNKTVSHVFIHDDTYVWVPAIIQSINSDNTYATVTVDASFLAEDDLSCKGAENKDTTVKVKLSDYPPNFELPLQNVRDGNVNCVDGEMVGSMYAVDDIVELPHVSEASILYNLKIRHKRNMPYTRIGSLMIMAVNPSRWIDGLYSEENRRKYENEFIWNGSGRSSTVSSLPPHIYEISSSAYYSLTSPKKHESQTIFISGESGSGKTETAKLLLTHLARISKPTSEIKSVEELTIIKKILDSNPIYEAFGNAKTGLNDNSSRFVKYEKLQYRIEGEKANFLGCITETFLLEKTRVVLPENKMSRSFHIFYQLLEAPISFKKKIWSKLVPQKGRIIGQEDFKYVNNSFTRSKTKLSDAEQFKNTLESLKAVGIDGVKLETLMRAVCVIMQLGNVSFTSPPGNDDGSTVSSSDELQLLCNLMNVSFNELSDTFTSRHVKVGSDLYNVPLTVQKAYESRDAIGKEMYSQIFYHLNETVNIYTHAEYSGTISTIAILDFFGFEVHNHESVNMFEQLCINYANEKLHHKYVQDSFITFIEEYKQEGLNLEDLEVKNNGAIIDLFEGPLGLFPILNEECIRPKASDSSFVHKFKAFHAGNSDDGCYLVQNRLHHKNEFGIKHYAGEVIYNSNQFLLKNADTLPHELVDVFSGTSNALISATLKKLSLYLRSSTAIGSCKRGSLVSRSVSNKFQSQLTSLIDRVQQTKCWYIRCIRPNDSMVPNRLKNDLVIHQIRAAGFVAAVAISRCTYPNKMKFGEVIRRYGMLGKEYDLIVNDSIGDKPSDRKTQVSALLSVLLKKFDGTIDGKKTSNAFVTGNSRVYFIEGAFEYLENEFSKKHYNQVLLLQSMARRYIAKNKYEESRAAAIKIQATTRSFVSKQSFVKQKEAGVRLQSLGRYVIAKAAAKKLKINFSATKIQSRWRRRSSLCSFDEKRAAAIKIQRLARRAQMKTNASDRLVQLIRDAKANLRAVSLVEDLEPRVKNMDIDEKDRSDLLDGITMISYLSNEVKTLRGKKAELDFSLIEVKKENTKLKTIQSSQYSFQALQKNAAKTREKNVSMNELLRDQAKKLTNHERESKKAKQSLYGLSNELSVLFNKIQELHQDNVDLAASYNLRIKRLEEDLQKEKRSKDAWLSEHIENLRVVERSRDNAVARLNQTKESLNSIEIKQREEKSEASAVLKKGKKVNMKLNTQMKTLAGKLLQKDEELSSLKKICSEYIMKQKDRIESIWANSNSVTKENDRIECGSSENLSLTPDVFKSLEKENDLFYSWIKNEQTCKDAKIEKLENALRTSKSVCEEKQKANEQSEESKSKNELEHDLHKELMALKLQCSSLQGKLNECEHSRCEWKDKVELLEEKISVLILSNKKESARIHDSMERKDDHSTGRIDALEIVLQGKSSEQLKAFMSQREDCTASLNKSEESRMILEEKLDALENDLVALDPLGRTSMICLDNDSCLGELHADPKYDTLDNCNTLQEVKDQKAKYSLSNQSCEKKLSRCESSLYSALAALGKLEEEKITLLQHHEMALVEKDKAIAALNSKMSKCKWCGIATSSRHWSSPREVNELNLSPLSSASSQKKKFPWPSPNVLSPQLGSKFESDFEYREDEEISITEFVEAVLRTKNVRVVDLMDIANERVKDYFGFSKKGRLVSDKTIRIKEAQEFNVPKKYWYATLELKGELWDPSAKEENFSVPIGLVGTRLGRVVYSSSDTARDALLFFVLQRIDPEGIWTHNFLPLNERTCMLRKEGSHEKAKWVGLFRKSERIYMTFAKDAKKKVILMGDKTQISGYSQTPGINPIPQDSSISLPPMPIIESAKEDEESF